MPREEDGSEGVTWPEATLGEKKSFLLAEAEVDDIDLGLVSTFANQASDADPALSRRERALALLRWMLDRGFVSVELRETGTVLSPVQNPEQILADIRAAWPEGDDDAEGSVGFAWWFRLPPERL